MIVSCKNKLKALPNRCRLYNILKMPVCFKEPSQVASRADARRGDSQDEASHGGAHVTVEGGDRAGWGGGGWVAPEVYLKYNFIF